MWPPLLLTRRKEQILQYLWCSFPLTLHLVGPQDGCNECSHKGQVKNTNYTNLSATVERSHLKGKCKLISERSKITSACTTYSIYSKKHHKLQSHSTKKIPFLRSSIDCGKPSDCSSFISSSLVAFFSSFVEDSFCGTSKKGEQTNKPMKLGFAPGKMASRYPIDYLKWEVVFQEKMAPRLRKLRITPMLKVDLMIPIFSPKTTGITLQWLKDLQ